MFPFWKPQEILQVSMKSSPRPWRGLHRHYCHLLPPLGRLNVSSSCSNISTAEGRSLLTPYLSASLGCAHYRCVPPAHRKRWWSSTAGHGKTWVSPISPHWPPRFQELPREVHLPSPQTPHGHNAERNLRTLHLV